MNCPWCSDGLDQYEILTAHTDTPVRVWYWCDTCTATFHSTIEVERESLRMKGLI